MQCLTIGLLAFTIPVGFEDEPQAPEEQYEALLEEWQSLVDELKTVPAGLESDEARRRFYEEIEEREHSLYARALQLAEGNADDPAAVDALAWVVYRGLPPERGEALERIIGNHVESPRLKPALSYVGMRRHHVQEDSDLYEAMLREVIARNPDHEVRGLAHLRLAQFLRLRADALRRLEQFPDYYRQLYTERYGLSPEELEGLRERTTTELAREAELLLERTIEKYASMEDLFYPGREDVSLGNLGDGAEKELYELRNLSIGRVAPEIEDRDIDGNPMRLSDYRGKVVTLVFWGTWCGPCMYEVPHHRSLVEQLEGRPFVLLGVNGGDEDREQVKKVMEREGITWRSWWDGNTQDGPIASQWNVDGWPTIYVLDHKGIIRFKDVRGEQLDEAVEALLAAAEQ